MIKIKIHYTTHSVVREFTTMGEALEFIHTEGDHVLTWERIK